MRNAWLAALLLCGTAAAEQLPIRVYSTADGLASNFVEHIATDQRGFLWFATREGLSRFDGYQFANFDVAPGSSDPSVNSVLPTRDGKFWLSTMRGIELFDPEAAKTGLPRFTVYAPPADGLFSQRVMFALAAGDGGLWLASFEGMYHVKRSAGGAPVFEKLPLPLTGSEPRVADALVDSRGALWVATLSGLFRRTPEGRLDHFSTAQGLPWDQITVLAEDHAGGLWAGSERGLAHIVASDDGKHLAARTYTTRDGLIHDRINSLLESSRGTLWVGTAGGLCRLVSRDPGAGFSCYASLGPLSRPIGPTLAEDRDGNIWIGAGGDGVAKLTPGGFVSYGAADGLTDRTIISIFETRSGEMCVMDGRHSWISRFDGKRFVPTRPNYLPRATDFGWGWNQIALQDHTGAWWLPSRSGVWRFPAVRHVEDLATTLPEAHYDTTSGLSGDSIFRVFEDSRGDVWLGTQAEVAKGPKPSLACWRRATGRVTNYPEADSLTTAFREDHDGNLWVGFYWGGVARFRNGRFTFFGTPALGMIIDLLVDHAGRLWIAGFKGGLARVDQPEAAQPHFVSITTADGLSSNNVQCLTEDRWGRIYAGTGHGVDRLDPASGRFRQYTIADGLAGVPIVAFRDHRGDIWFGTYHGISRISPEPDGGGGLPSVWMSGIQVAGVARPISDYGEAFVRLPTLEAAQNHLMFSFVGLSFAPGEKLLYQCRLDGVDQHWSGPSEQRAVNYAGLGPGRYRFQVRAINSQGASSLTPATVEFQIAAPLWRRLWFQATLLFAFLAVLYAAYRFRVAQLMALERVRMHIATELHDDIGSGLTRIAILSDAAMRDPAATKAPAVVSPLTTIAGLSRELGESMGDIVWSVNPARDHLQDLALRMRRHASETFGAVDVTLRFRGPAADADRKVPPETRRQVFLIFKEAANNAVMHSRCKEVEIDLRVEDRRLVFRMRDDGIGFDTASGPAAKGGNGLGNMRRRASDIDAAIEIVSSSGRGTAISLTVPLASRGPDWKQTLLKLAGKNPRLVN